MAAIKSLFLHFFRALSHSLVQTNFFSQKFVEGFRGFSETRNKLLLEPYYPRTALTSFKLVGASNFSTASNFYWSTSSPFFKMMWPKKLEKNAFCSFDFQFIFFQSSENTF